MDERENYRRIDLAPIWSLIEVVGEMRENQKRNFQSSRLWRGKESTHIPAIAGEVVAAILIKSKMNAKLDIRGDNGYDLEDGTDVKTVTYWPPILKHPINSRRWPKYFALVYLDERNKIGFFIGKIKSEELRTGIIQNFGHGDNYTLSCEDVYNKSLLKFR